jgi:hypothetical protein
MWVATRASTLQATVYAAGTSRPRARSVDDKELPIATYEYFADRDPLQRAVMDRMLAGASTGKFARVGEPVGTEVERTAVSKDKSTVSEMSIEKTRTTLAELITRRLDDMRLAVMMLDGLEIAGRVHVVALAISTEGVKFPLGCGKARRRTRRSPARCAGRSHRPRPRSWAGNP